MADAEIDLSCPNGCFELTVTGRHEGRDAVEYIEDVALQDEPGPCPNCHAALEPEVKAGG